MLYTSSIFNLTFDGLFSDLSFNGGGGLKVPPLFSFVKTIENVFFCEHFCCKMYPKFVNHRGV